MTAASRRRASGAAAVGQRAGFHFLGEGFGLAGDSGGGLDEGGTGEGELGALGQEVPVIGHWQMLAHAVLAGCSRGYWQRGLGGSVTGAG